MDVEEINQKEFKLRLFGFGIGACTVCGVLGVLKIVQDLRLYLGLDILEPKDPNGLWAWVFLPSPVGVVRDIALTLLFFALRKRLLQMRHTEANGPAARRERDVTTDCARSQRTGKFLKPLVAHLHSVCHSRRERGISIFHGCKRHQGINGRFTLDFAQLYSHHEWLTAHSVTHVPPSLSVDDFSSIFNFLEDTVTAKLLAHRIIAPLPGVLPTDPNIHLANGHDPPVGAGTPTTHKVWLHISPPYEVGGRVETALDENFPF